VKAIRYNENNYVIKGYFERDIFMRLIEIGIIYRGYRRFYIPVGLKEKVNEIVQIKFIDDIVDWIHYGYHQEEAVKKSIFAVQDLNGSYIYILDPELTISGIKKITEIPYFPINLSQIKKFNIQLNRKLYIEDCISNTDLNINNPELKALLYSQKDGFCVHNVVNRVGLYLHTNK
jgi:hypothetical protein